MSCCVPRTIRWSLPNRGGFSAERRTSPGQSPRQPEPDRSRRRGIAAPPPPVRDRPVQPAPSPCCVGRCRERSRRIGRCWRRVRRWGAGMLLTASWLHQGFLRRDSPVLQSDREMTSFSDISNTQLRNCEMLSTWSSWTPHGNGSHSSFRTSSQGAVVGKTTCPRENQPACE